MFIAALSTTVKLWKEPRCPSTDEWIEKMWYVCIYIYIVDVYVCVCVCVYHIFFIHSSVNAHLGHLGSFHSLAIVDIAAINIRVNVPLWITTFVSLVQLLGHRVALLSTF